MKIAVGTDEKKPIRILEIDDGSFISEVLQFDKPVLVDFWAPWCGPCKAIGPVVERLAETYSDQFRFAKCNVDQNPETLEKHGEKKWENVRATLK